MKGTVLGKNPPGKNPPDSKPNPIPNLTLILPLTPHGGFFPGGGWGFFIGTKRNCFTKGAEQLFTFH